MAKKTVKLKMVGYSGLIADFYLRQEADIAMKALNSHFGKNGDLPENPYYLEIKEKGNITYYSDTSTGNATANDQRIMQILEQEAAKRGRFGGGRDRRG